MVLNKSHPIGLNSVVMPGELPGVHVLTIKDGVAGVRRPLKCDPLRSPSAAVKLLDLKIRHL